MGGEVDEDKEGLGWGGTGEDGEGGSGVWGGGSGECGGEEVVDGEAVMGWEVRVWELGHGLVEIVDLGGGVWMFLGLRTRDFMDTLWHKGTCARIEATNLWFDC